MEEVGEGGRSCGCSSQYAREIAKCRLGNGGSGVLAVPEWRQRGLSLLKEAWM